MGKQVLKLRGRDIESFIEIYKLDPIDPDWRIEEYPEVIQKYFKDILYILKRINGSSFIIDSMDINSLTLSDKSVDLYKENLIFLTTKCKEELEKEYLKNSISIEYKLSLDSFNNQVIHWIIEWLIEVDEDTLEDWRKET